MRNEHGKLIIGLCGSTIGARKEAVELFAEKLKGLEDLTIPGSVRATWRRGEHLFNELDAANSDNLVAVITCREEAESIEMMGGHVIHVEGTPSDDIAIKRDTILLTFKPQGRGRYTTVSETLEKLGVAA